MKLRLTPLNIASALLLVLLISPWLPGAETKTGVANAVLLCVLTLLSFVADILFRSFLRNLKRIWIIELLFIIFAAVLILIIHQF